MSAVVHSHKSFNQQLKKYYGVYTGGFIVFLVLLAIAEQMGLSKQWIGYCFLAGTILLTIWFIVTYVEGWYARELNSITFLGFPLGFYMSAQGSLIIYVAIIGIYARYMNNLDRVYGVHEGEDE